MSLLVDVLAAVLLLSGGLLSLLAALGLLRFPDVLARLQAAGKPQVLGLVLVLAGVAPAAAELAEVTTLLLVAVFQLVTTPVATQLVGRAAYRAGHLRRDLLVRDDLRAAGEQRRG